MSKPPKLLKEHLENEKDRMFRIAWKMCGNPDDAQDVLQETAVKALKNWHQFRGDAQISTWLYKIASNTCLSKQRKQSRETVDPELLEKLSQGFHGDAMLTVNDWSRDPLELTLNDELRESLDKAILKLPEVYRLVFLMRDVEGMSGEETAKALGITPTNVKVRLHRARLYLRNELNDYMIAHDEV